MVDNVNVVQFSEDGTLFKSIEEIKFKSYRLDKREVDIESDPISGRAILDLGANGFKFVTGRYEFNETSFEYKVARTILSDITTEMYLRSVLTDREVEDLVIKGGLDRKINGKFPDVFFENVDARFRGTVWEFKSSLNDFTERRIKSISEEVKEKYGSLGEVKVIFLKLDKNFASNLKLPRLHSRIYESIRRDVEQKVKTSNDKFVKLFEYGSTLPSGIELIERMGILSDKDGVLNPSNNKYIKTKDEIMSQIWQNIKPFEDFFNLNYLEQKDAGKTVFEPAMRQSNIWSGSMWDRDSNRTKTSEHRSKTTNFGHRAKYLFNVPLFNTLENSNFIDTEMKELVHDEKFLQVFEEMMLGDVLQEVIGVSIFNQDLLDWIREAQGRVAFLETEATRETESLGDMESLNQKINDFHNEIKSKIELAEIESKLSTKITKSGYIRVPLNKERSYWTGINRNYNKWNKDELDTIDVNSFQFDFDSVLNNFGNLEPLDINVSFPYGDHVSVDFFKDIQQGSLRRFNKIWTSKIHWYLFYYWKVVRAYISAYPGLTGRRTQSNDFRFIRVDKTPVYLLVTPSPNQITSGMIIAITRHKKGTVLPNYCLPHKSIDTETGTWMVSKPFRFNRKILTKFDEVIGSFYGVSTLMAQYDVNIWENGFFASLYYDYSRQLSLAIDALYLLYKNAPNIGSLGRNEYKKKFEELYIKDIRVAHIVKAITEGYEEFSSGMVRFATYYKVEGIHKGAPSRISITDPVFGIQINGLQTFLTLTYMKQIFPKNDGYDEAKVAATFFKKEMDFQTEYDNSKFHPNLVNPLESMSVADFIKRVFNVDFTDWEKITYHPDSCYLWTKDLVATAYEGATPTDPYTDSIIAETGKNTKVLIPTTQLRRKPGRVERRVFVRRETPLTKKQKIDFEEPVFKSAYAGFESSNLTEAIHTEITNTADWLANDYDKLVENNDLKLTFDSGDLSTTNLKMSHVIAYELTRYPKHYFVIVKVKEQKGKDKRIFFVQNLFARNLNSFLDGSLQHLLQRTPEDIINKAGDEKNIEVEKLLDWSVAESLPGLIVTIDQTRYGDLFPVESFEPLIMALRDTGYYSDTLAKLFLFAINALKKRLIFLPVSSKKEYEQFKLGKFQDTSIPRNKHLSDFFNQFEVLDKHPSKLEGFTDINPDNAEIFQDNPSMRKDPGFILGVFNRLGSVLSACSMRMADDLLTFLGLTGLIRGVSHSDDAIMITKAPRISESDLRNNDITELIGKMFSNGSLKGTIIPSTRRQFNLLVDDELSVVHGPTIVKLISLVSMLTPRFFGQRTSFTKWGISSVGEILQTYCVAGKMIPPLVRYAAAIGAELPGKSPASDLNHIMSRVYQMKTGGLSDRGLNDMLMVLNIFNYMRFGISPNEIENPFERIPELGGWWYMYPGFLDSMGFLGNEVRLYSIADQNSELGASMRNQLMMMINTDTVFKQVEVKSLSPNNIEVSEPEGFIGAPETRKDFFIRFSRSSRTSSSFFTLMNSFVDDWKLWWKTAGEKLSRGIGGDWSVRIEEVNKLLQKDEITKSEASASIRTLFLLFGDRIISKTEDKLIKSVSFLHRYLTKSFQESYARIPDGAVVINRIGYLNRHFANPFSQGFKEANPNLDSSVYTIAEIWGKIFELSLGKVNGLEENNRFFSFFKKLWTEYIFLVRSSKLSLGIGTGRAIERDLILKWVKRQPHHVLTLLKEQSVSVLIATLIQKTWQPGVSVKELPIARSHPKVIGDPNFESSLEFFSQLLTSTGIIGNRLMQHANIISRLFASRVFITVTRFNIDITFSEALRDGWSQLLIYPNARSEIIDLLQPIQSSELNVPSDTLLRLNNLLLITDLTSPELIKTRIQFNGSEIKTIDYLTSKHVSVEPNKPNVTNYNIFLTNVLLSEFGLLRQRDTSLRFFRNQTQTVVACAYKGHWYALRELLVSEMENKTMYDAFTTNSIALTTAFMLKMLSYFAHSKKRRLTNFQSQCPGSGGSFSIDLLDTLVFKNKVGNTAIKVVNSSTISDLIRNTRLFQSRISDDGRSFLFEEDGFKIAPWRLINVPTNIRILKEDGELVINDSDSKEPQDDSIPFPIPEKTYINVMFFFALLRLINEDVSSAKIVLKQSDVGKIRQLEYVFRCFAPFSVTIRDIFDIIEFNIRKRKPTTLPLDLYNAIDTDKLLNSESWAFKCFTLVNELALRADSPRQFLKIHQNINVMISEFYSTRPLDIIERYLLFDDINLASSLGDSLELSEIEYCIYNGNFFSKVYKPTLMIKRNDRVALSNSMIILRSGILESRWDFLIRRLVRFSPFPMIRHGSLAPLIEFNLELFRGLF